MFQSIEMNITGKCINTNKISNNCGTSKYHNVDKKLSSRSETNSHPLMNSSDLEFEQNEYKNNIPDTSQNIRFCLSSLSTNKENHVYIPNEISNVSVKGHRNLNLSLLTSDQIYSSQGEHNLKNFRTTGSDLLHCWESDQDKSIVSNFHSVATNNFASNTLSNTNTKTSHSNTMHAIASYRREAILAPNMSVDSTFSINSFCNRNVYNEVRTNLVSLSPASSEDTGEDIFDVEDDDFNGFKTSHQNKTFSQKEFVSKLRHDITTDEKVCEIDMKVIEPYKRILSHGGYLKMGGQNAIVMFSACHLPDKSRADYHYVMDNLFLYVIQTLEQLITDDYVLIYLHGGSNRRNIPPFPWLKKCYQLLDRRLRKSLKNLYLVHPTFWLKSIVWMTRPFVSSKFWRKLIYVYSLEELYSMVSVEKTAIPDKVKYYDAKFQ